MRTDKRASQKSDKKASSRVHKRGIVGYSKKSALLEEAITHMNSGKYGRSSAALKELLALDPQNIEARRLFATLHLKLGSLVTARQAFESLANEAIGRQDYWLAESLLNEYLAAGPRCVPFLEQLAQVYQEKGDEIAAVVELGKAIEILRDDPDPDHPQKAAQLYSKIRELAPASSVAFQLASLFDVQTGEFLVHPSAPSGTSSEDHPADSASVANAEPAPAPIEHPLPEVMPWELTDEPAASQERESEPSSIASSAEASELPPPPAVDESVEPPVETFSYEAREPAAEEPSIDGSVGAGGASESALPPIPAVPAPMPWEQMADASVQIPEPETPVVDGSSALESVLASLRTEEEALAPPVAVEPASPSATDSVPSETPSAPEPARGGVSSLSAPMPWEQISDPAIQIPVPEPEPPAPSSTASFGIPSTEHQASEPTPEFLAAPEQTEHSPAPVVTSEPEASSMTPTEIPPASSFSWNSVFDKAWKFTAGTMAPSPTVPPENHVEMSAGSVESVESSAAPAPPDAHPLPEPAIALEANAPVEVAQEESPTPIAMKTPVSFASPVDEPVEQEAVSTPFLEPSPPQPVEPLKQEPSSHWSTGEVAVQVHRPSKKKKRWDKEQEQPEASDSESEPTREWKTIDEPAPREEPVVSEPHDVRPDWMQATDAITFAPKEPLPPPMAPPFGWSDASVAQGGGESASVNAAASAVDVLFAPSALSEDVPPHRPSSWSIPRPRLMARVHRVRIAISSFIGSCFSTTRSLTFLAFMMTIATVLVASAGIGALALMWAALEETPSPLYQTLTVSPPRVITDAKKNGYLLLLGFDAPDGEDPVQAGYERRAQPERDLPAAQVCIGEDVKLPTGTGGASDQVLKGWVRSGDVLSAVKGQGGTIKSLTARESTALARYQQWLTMPFDDWGFGQSFSPNCSRLLLTHRLYLLEGFNQDVSTGLERLEIDVQAWRMALGQAKTLPVKMLALAAMQDDASVAAGLLSRSELDAPALARLSKMVRPLDQVELSVRWPMQSQFVAATKAVPSQLKDDKANDRPWHVSMAAAMRLPVQRRANAYAEYYDAANKAVAGGRYTNLPKAATFVRTPPSSITDYLVNPVEHIVGIEPLPSWEPFVYRVIETDAQLRLAGLQAWLRRGPQDGDVLMRLAKAGQAYYDPFTGLPMLVNQRKGVIYSVGRDGKDQEGDSLRDVTAIIPALSAFDSRRSAVLGR